MQLPRPLHRYSTRSAHLHIEKKEIVLLYAHINHSVSHRGIFYLCSYLFLFFSGARETDYPAGEEVALNSETGLAGDGRSQSTNSSSAGGDGALGGITVVGCEAEGALAVPQTAVSQENDGETGE